MVRAATLDRPVRHLRLEVMVGRVGDDLGLPRVAEVGALLGAAAHAVRRVGHGDAPVDELDQQRLPQLAPSSGGGGARRHGVLREKRRAARRVARREGRARLGLRPIERREQPAVESALVRVRARARARVSVRALTLTLTLTLTLILS